MAFEVHPVDFANVLFGLSVVDVSVNGVPFLEHLPLGQALCQALYLVR